MIVNLTKKQLTHIISYVLTLAVLYFFISYLVGNWQKVQELDFTINYWYLVLATAVWAVGYVCFALIWRHIIKTIGPHGSLTPKKAIGIYMLTEFGKYIPGKVWIIAGRVLMATKHGIDKKNLLVGALLDNILSIIAILIVGVIFFLFELSSEQSSLILLAFGMIVAGLICLQPRIFYPVINFGLKKIGKPTITDEARLVYIQILTFTGIYILADILLGISFFIFVNAITPIALTNFFAVAAAFCLAGGLGVALLFAPSGIGVREGVIVALLQLVMPLPMAVSISILARLWTTIGELLLLLFAFVLNNLGRNFVITSK